MLSRPDWRADLASWRTAVLTIDSGYKRVTLRSGEDTGS